MTMINPAGNRISLEIRRQSDLSHDIARLQIEISSGKRIQQPSEDPVASARVANIRRAQADDIAWNRTIELGSSLTSQADGVLKSLANRMARAQELTVEGASATASSADRASIALELRSIAAEIDSLSQTQTSQGDKLFAAGPALKMRFGEDAVFAPVPSHHDVFARNGVPLATMINDAATALQSGISAQIDTAITTVANGVDHVATVAGDLGIRAARIDTLREVHQSRGIDFAAERSGLEDTDLSEAIAKLNSNLTTLEAAQAAFARINRRTLFQILG
jgi:flagellar hook-associated protein 3 FlgL